MLPCGMHQAHHIQQADVPPLQLHPPGVPSTAQASSAPSTGSSHACRCLPMVMQWLCALRSPAGADTVNEQKPSALMAAASAVRPGAMMPAGDAKRPWRR